MTQQIDRTYLARWADKLGVADWLESVLERADTSPAGEDRRES